MATKILVTGANGQLGQELKDISFINKELKFEFHDRTTLDILSEKNVSKSISKFKPDFLINCAAYTKVDHAEIEKELAFSINATALEYLSEACNKSGTTLIHISTDYVYDSINKRPLIENDPLNPEGNYANSKKDGEDILQSVADKWIIIRTSWVYSSYGNNFVKTMLRLGRGMDEINIVDDQIGTPTYAKDIAGVLIVLIKKLASAQHNTSLTNEIYNFSNSGYTSWDDFARKIFELSNIECHVTGISTKDYGAKASRPLWSVLSKEKIESSLNIKIRNWEAALAECLDILLK